MAAPATTGKFSYRFRDAKGRTSHMTFKIGDATIAAVWTDYNNGAPLLQAISNAHVSAVQSVTPDYTYGGTSDYQNVEDKAIFTFRNYVGALSKFQVPAPKSTIFQNDQETVNETNADVEAWVTWMQTFVYTSAHDTAPLALVGATRLRRKMQRRLNIWVLDPTLGEEAE